MASTSDIADVRRNVNEPDDETYSDEAIGAMVDADGIAGASARIWRAKAARYAELVNVSEAGASHSYSDLHKNAINMAKAFDSVESEDEAPPIANRVRVQKIVRS